jgi:hypothetical protein
METPPPLDPPPAPPLEREVTPPSAWRLGVWLWAILWCGVVLFLGTCGLVALNIGADAY